MSDIPQRDAAVRKLADANLAVGQAAVDVRAVTAGTTSADDPAATAAALRSEIAALAQENKKLRDQLAAQQRPPTAPEDFATGIQHTLDKLQNQLNTMTNPVSNFAVKTFRLETSVGVTVTPLGTVQYRFVTPNEAVDPATLSKLTLELVPLVKQNASNTYTSSHFQPDVGIESIASLTVPQQQLLRSNGVDTVADFIAVGTRARSGVQLGAMLGTDRLQLANLVGGAQLLTLKGIDPGRAKVLAAAGVDSLAKVAALTPDDLAKRFADQQTKAPVAGVKPLGIDEATSLVHAAKSFQNP